MTDPQLVLTYVPQELAGFSTKPINELLHPAADTHLMDHGREKDDGH